MPFKAQKIKLVILDQLGASVISFTIVLASLFYYILFLIAFAQINSTLLICTLACDDTRVNLERCAY